MSLRSLEYAIVESLTAIRRNALMSLASIATVTLTLTVLAAFVLFLLGTHRGMQMELRKLEIAVWLDKTKTDADIVELKAKLEALPYVRSARFIPASVTWEKIKDDWSSQLDLSGVEPSSVMADLDSFRVKLKSPEHTLTAAREIRRMRHVQEVVSAQQIAKDMLKLTDLIKWIGGATAGVLLLVVAFLISNTIRLMIYARRREIRIMQLVGATNWFIRLPLLFEGTILGALGGAISCVIVLGGSRSIAEWVTRSMPLLGTFSSGVDPAQFSAGLLILGCLIGMIGSLVSIQRFLKA